MKNIFLASLYLFVNCVFYCADWR